MYIEPLYKNTLTKDSLHCVFGYREVNGLRRQRACGMSCALMAQRASLPTKSPKMQPNAYKCFRNCI